jgi:hypothetical protein
MPIKGGIDLAGDLARLSYPMVVIPKIYTNMQVLDIRCPMLFLRLQPKCLPAGDGIWVIERSFSQRDDPVSHSAPIVVADSSSARIFNLEVPTRLFLLRCSMEHRAATRS